MDNIAIAVAVITGLTEVGKRLGLSTRYVPLLAVILGVIYAGFVVGWYSQSIVGGIVTGLTSVGLFRAVQKTIQ